MPLYVVLGLGDYPTGLTHSAFYQDQQQEALELQQKFEYEEGVPCWIEYFHVVPSKIGVR